MIDIYVYYLFIMNKQMGNVVLMPQFYGIGVKKHSKKKISNKTQATNKNQQGLQVLKVNFKSTYDDYSQPSMFSNQRSVSLIEGGFQIQRTGEKGYLNTQQSLDEKRNEPNPVMQSPTKTSNLQVVFTRQQQISADQDDPFSSCHQSSLINSVMEIEDTALEKKQSIEKCKTLLQIGEQQWRDGSFSKSLAHLQEVLSESQASFPQDINEKAKVYSILGSNCLRMGLYDRSADYYLKALSLLQTDPQTNIRKISDVHLTLGTIYQRTNYLDEAVEHFQLAYTLKTKFMEKMAPQFLNPLSNLAELEARRGNHIKAIQRYCQTLSINKVIYGSSHIQVARNFFLMANSLFQIKQYSMWLEYHYECIRMMKDLRMEQHPDYSIWLKAFPQRLRVLIGIQHYSKDIVERSIYMANLLLSRDQQIEFLSKIKGDMESSVAESR